MNADMTQMAIIALGALLVGVAAFALLSAIFSGEEVPARRLEKITGARKARKSSTSLIDRLGDSKQEGRRRQIEESLKQFTEEEKKRQKVTLAIRLKQAGMSVNEKQFYAYSLIIGFFAALGVFALMRDSQLQLRAIVAAGAFLAGAFGLPRWYVSMRVKKRQAAFLDAFADAIDIMVRGLRSGLPVGDAMKVIGTEIPAPVGPEFMQVVEGQKVGISIDQGVERMYERVPLPEVNFLSIVITIQKQTGGNLSETLANLSRVLRDRKKMKQKIKSISQEAKASAAIIGALPFLIMGGLMIFNPDYLNPLWHTKIGNILVGGSAFWMGLGVLVMRKMINFKI